MYAGLPKRLITGTVSSGISKTNRRQRLMGVFFVSGSSGLVPENRIRPRGAIKEDRGGNQNQGPPWRPSEKKKKKTVQLIRNLCGRASKKFTTCFSIKSNRFFPSDAQSKRISAWNFPGPPFWVKTNFQEGNAVHPNFFFCFLPPDFKSPLIVLASAPKIGAGSAPSQVPLTFEAPTSARGGTRSGAFFIIPNQMWKK